jgi:hypothetical protein
MTPTERVREWRARQPKRKCECGRDIDTRCQTCSECSAVNRSLNQDIYRHNYKVNNPKKVIASYNYFNRKDVKVFNRLLRQLEGIS